ncbi:DUF6624 domain-containing protein [Anditalea andensis]|uniref:Uncharacterized protein n=1 Tax=Anditalea andensis TaxID=1048983 RepID=A0A074L225_9BACT|nr:DUF6624 domain-containing protein [Anditalea andensis]KEO75204.1 hypothetical protein EL17_05960 [Anditalea andensis]
MYRLCFLLSIIAFPSFGQEKANAYQVKHIPYDSLKTVLEEMYDTDQGIRRQFVEAMQIGSTETGNLAKKMNEIDSINQIQVKKILENYGWLGKSLVGHKAARALFYVVQHAELDIMVQYYESLKAQADIGEANPLNAAMMLDRILMYQNKKQVYGTQASNLVRNERVSVIWPVEDPENVNKRRKSVGFKSTLEESAASMNAIYDPKEELPKENVWE